MFKNDFAWGVSAAAYQIEGATNEGGRTPSVWDMYCLKSGAIERGETGDIACDFYHKYKVDNLTFNAYRNRKYHIPGYDDCERCHSEQSEQRQTCQQEDVLHLVTFPSPMFELQRKHRYL